MSFVLRFRWNGGDYEVEVPSTASVFDLKLQIETLTSVEHAKQKLIGLKSPNGVVTDDTCVNDLKLKPEQRIMMLGWASFRVLNTLDVEASTPNAVIEETSRAAELAPVVEDDFDFDPSEALTMELAQRPESKLFEKVFVLLCSSSREAPATVGDG